MPPPRRTSVEGVIAVLLFAALIGVVIVQILGRTPVMTGPVWTEEAARWLWVWMAFVGIAEVERQDQHLRMGFLAEMLPAVVRRVVFTMIDLIWLGVVLHLTWIGLVTVQRTTSHAAVSLPVPNAVLYASGAVAFALCAHRIVRRIAAGRSAATVSGPAL